MKAISEQGEIMGAKPGLTSPKGVQIPYRLLRSVLFLAIGVLVVAILDRVQHDTVLTLADTRPIAQIAAAVLGVLAIWSVAQAVTLGFVHRQQIAWRMSFRTVGWVGLVASITGVAVLIFQAENDRITSLCFFFDKPTTNATASRDR